MNKQTFVFFSRQTLSKQTNKQWPEFFFLVQTNFFSFQTLPKLYNTANFKTNQQPTKFFFHFRQTNCPTLTKNCLKNGSAKCRTLSAPATAAAHKIPPKRKATGMHIPPTLHSYTALHTQLSLGEHTTTATRTRGDYSKKTTISKWLSPHLTKPNTIFAFQ